MAKQYGTKYGIEKIELTKKEQSKLKTIKVDLLARIVRDSKEKDLTLKEWAALLNEELINVPSEFDMYKNDSVLCDVLKKYFTSGENITTSSVSVQRYLEALDYVKKNGVWHKNKKKLKESEIALELTEVLKSYAVIDSTIKSDLQIYPIETSKGESFILIEEAVTKFLGKLYYGCLHMENLTLVYTNAAGQSKLDLIFKKIKHRTSTK